MSNAGVCLRVGQEICDQPQNFCIALRSIIESRGIDESNRSPVQIELFRELDSGCTRLQVISDWKFRTTCEIDKLEVCRLSL